MQKAKRRKDMKKYGYRVKLCEVVSANAPYSGKSNKAEEKNRGNALRPVWFLWKI